MPAASSTALVLATRGYDAAGLSEHLRALDLHIEHCDQEPRFALEDQTHARFIVRGQPRLATAGPERLIRSSTEPYGRPSIISVAMVSAQRGQSPEAHRGIPC